MSLPTSFVRPLAAACLLAMATAPALAQAGRTAPAQPAATALAAAAAHPSRAFWLDQQRASASARGAEMVLSARRFRALTLDRASLAGVLSQAPAEFSSAARQSPLVLSLPDPAGKFQRFSIVDSPVMEPALAAKHPGIRTYAGRGIDDPTASLRLSLTPLGLQVSVRSQHGAWFIEPVYHLDESLYGSYWRQDAVSRRAPLVEPFVAQAALQPERLNYRADETVRMQGAGFLPGRTVVVTVRRAGESAPILATTAVAELDGSLVLNFKADPAKGSGSIEVTATDGRTTALASYRVAAANEPLLAAVGHQLRTYRLALLTDPLYANYFGAANVTAAKVQLINRVTQIYEDETSIRLVLIGENDRLNLNTTAEMTGTNGPCGATACYTTSQASGCSSSNLTRTRQVIGLLVGARNFDIGHIALGSNGGGIASLGVVGGNAKAQGCTGINPPTGDVFAIDFVAHEMGHQFAGNHTFNGTQGNCSGGNRSAANSVEPGSGSSVMAYAGICSTDNLQANSDPVWSQRSFDEITNYTSASETNINEVQQGALTGFTTNGLQFRLRFGGVDSAPIVRGTNFTTAGIQAAIQGIAGWPAGGTAAVSALSDGGFTVTFGGTLAGSNVDELELVDCTGGCSGFIGEIAKGGATTRGGSSIVATGNTAPTATVPGPFTIPVRTPFALTGSGSDADGDTVTYLWEQTDRGAASGTALINNTKANGPLFRQFSTRAMADSSQYAPPGQNLPGTNPTRVFPDMAQILAGNTNAETGGCPDVVSPPSVANIDCYSEFLPTVAYVGFAGVNASPARLNFRLTVRDGRGGVNAASTTLTLAPEAGPFLVSAPNGGGSLDGAEPTTVTWSVANTSVAPVNTTAVRILLSTDGGASWPVVLASNTPNNGSAAVTIPNIGTTQARVKVEAIGNVFFDVSNADFAIRFTGDVDGNGVINCSDIELLRRYLGLSAGEPGFNPAFDFNNDGRIDALDTAYVTKRLPLGVVCSTPPRRF